MTSHWCHLNYLATVHKIKRFRTTTVLSTLKHALCQVVWLKQKEGIKQTVACFGTVVINTAICLRQSTAAVSVEHRVTECNAVVSTNRTHRQLRL